jgi:PTS system N-acetylglucosamine-specific IIC component
MSGFFPVMMFGLPGACLAMYRAARPDRREAIGGLLLSIALTSFLTGVTEPIEFTFMFIAPLLYIVHALMTGLAMVVMHALGVHLGFSFSAGLFDYMLNYSLATRPLWLLPIGAGYFALYYGVFYYGIVRFNLATPGRELAPQAVGAHKGPAPASRAAGMVAALGGAANLTAVDACTTRLRLSVAESARIDVGALTQLGALGIVRAGPNAVQVVMGPIADQVAGEIRRYLKSPAEQDLSAGATEPDVVIPVAEVLAALGGAANVKSVECASERVLVQVARQQQVNCAALESLGARGVVISKSGLVHVLLGAASADTCAALHNLVA